MKRIFSGICAAALMAATLVGGVAPASAQFGEAIREGRIPPGNYIDNVRPDRRYRREYRRDRREFRREQREFRRDRRDFYRDGRYAYFHGHRGYPRYRRGYREFNGFWFPLAAFAAGAIISGAINSQPSYRDYGSAHVEWCYDRWRSYRAYDNTYQPYHGPRKQCDSPYS